MFKTHHSCGSSQLLSLQLSVNHKARVSAVLLIHLEDSYFKILSCIVTLIIWFSVVLLCTSTDITANLGVNLGRIKICCYVFIEFNSMSVSLWRNKLCFSFKQDLIGLVFPSKLFVSLIADYKRYTVWECQLIWIIPADIWLQSD